MAVKSILRIRSAFLSKANYQQFSWIRCLCSEAYKDLNNEGGTKTQNVVSGKFSNHIHLSSWLTPNDTNLSDLRIEVVDAETWGVSSSLAEAWKGGDRTVKKPCSIVETVDELESFPHTGGDEPDFDDLEDMRIRGNLFFKIDRDSREFEEYNFDFHRKKSSKEGNKQDPKEKGKSNKDLGERGNTQKMNCNASSKVEELSKIGKLVKKKNSIDEMDDTGTGKKERTLTFNQLTAPYHEPFCLDIYISKSSVRACIIHRLTSKVVAVAHSISKDLKFDLSSTKNTAACAAVGGCLAQRALADDIHNVVYTPRKGEKLEGKLQIVLQAIIDNGINVKVRIKKMKVRKAFH